MTIQKIHYYAALYLACGFPLKLLKQGTKDEPVKITPFYHLIQDGPLEDWLDGLDYNLGIMMGQTTHDRNIIAIDFDSEESYQTWKEQNIVLADSATAKTSRGYHVLFELDHPCGNWKSDEISIISDGWFIVVEPSIHPSGHHYEWLKPPWEGINCEYDVFYLGIDMSKLTLVKEDEPYPDYDSYEEEFYHDPYEY